MKKGCLVALAVLALCVSPFFIHPILNNRRLNRVEDSFARLQHPAQSTLVKRMSDVGLLIGNSNHCDFFVGELRTYSGTQAQISSFYKKATVWSPIFNNQQPVSDIVFLKQGAIPSEMQQYLSSNYRTNKDWSIPPAMKNRPLYIVYFLDVGTFNEGCDLRCS